LLRARAFGRARRLALGRAPRLHRPAPPVAVARGGLRPRDAYLGLDDSVRFGSSEAEQGEPIAPPFEIDGWDPLEIDDEDDEDDED